MTITESNGTFTFSATDTNTDTNTSHGHAAGVGLVGSGSAGTSNGTYNYKAKLRSETALTVDSAAATTTSGRVYPVAVDKSGYLSVNVPWTDTDTNTHYTQYLQIKGNDIEAVKYTQNSDKSLNLKPGNHVQISAAAGEITISADDTTYNNATQSASGLMSSSDKTKLDGIATGANKTIVDSTLSSTSANPVQNKVINSSLNSKLDKIAYEWNKSISFGGSGYLKIGAFPMYDTNITIDIDSTTHITYHATVIIATQNVNSSSIGSAHAVQVYGDASNTITPNIRVVWNSGSNIYTVYFVPAG